MTTTLAPPTLAVARTIDATKVYGSGERAVRALDDVTVDIPSNRFTAVMGPSGSGKSTLMHCLAGLDSLTSGSVFIGDTDLGTLSDRQLTRLRRERIGFVFQAFNLLPTLTAGENVMLPLMLAGRRPGRRAALGWPSQERPEDGWPEAGWPDEVIASLGIGDRLSHRPSELSGGQQQRVAIARALVTRPALVFADEPTGNLDSTTGAEVLALLRAAVRDLDQTVVMVTHDPVAASYADGVLFLADGRIVGQMSEPSPESVLDRLKGLGG